MVGWEQKGGAEALITRLQDPSQADGLFDGWRETIIWSCLQGIMGSVYGDAEQAPGSAMAVLGDFCFFAGRPNREVASFRPPEMRAYMLLVPQREEWAGLIEQQYGTSCRRITRYALKKGGERFDRAQLAQAQMLPPGYVMKRMDRVLFQLCESQEWSRDLVRQFPGYEAFRRLGLGVVVLKDGVPVSGAASYSRYREGIEIEIDTRPDYRRRGLAYACGAGLISDCLERGLYPSWDAHDKRSLALARKLGYRLDRPYPAYEVRP